MKPARRGPSESAGGAKKARWTRAQKLDSQRTRARQQVRGDGPARPGRRDARPERGQDARPQRWDAPRPRTEQGGSGRWDRDERPRRWDRDDRGSGAAGRGDRPSYRDDRPTTHGDRDDRRPSYRDRDDRRSSHGDRAERPSYGGRDDRRPSSGDRQGRSSGYGDRDDRRPPHRGRDDRPGYQGRDERSSYRGRDERPSYGGRDERRPSHGGRDDRPSYRGRDERPSYGGRDERRPSYRDRDERPSYRDRDERRPSSRDRAERPSYRDRDERPSYRDDRRPPSGDRAERPSYRDRDDRRPGHRDGDDRRDLAPRRAHVEDVAAASPAHESPAHESPAHESAAAEGLPAGPAPETAQAQDPGATAAAAPPQGPTFADLGLPELLVDRLARDGITTAFPIQAATIPDALAGRDVLGRGRTGSGKTLSFGLPTLARLAAGGRARPQQPRAVVLAPTRELAMQVSDVLQPLVHVLGLRHKLVAGGMPYEPQLQALERGVDVLVATPGRLIDLMERGAADLSQVEVAILDEADHMAEMGFLEAITQILDAVPAGGQRLLFSATLDRGIDRVVETYLVDPVTHSTDDAAASVTTMQHHALLVEPQHKKAVTAQVANRDGRTVVFCRTKLGADRVSRELREQGVVAAALHGGLNQGQRNKVLAAFKDGRVPVLVATDVAARGIHVDDVGVVLQLDPPADHKDYLHRAGRTARAGESGTVVSLVLPHQRKTVQRLLEQAGVDVELQRAEPGDEVIARAGGSTPRGGSVSEDDLYRLLTPARRGPRSGGPGRGSRSGGHGGGGYGGDRGGHGRPRQSGYRGQGGRRDRDDRWGPRRPRDDR